MRKPNRSNVLAIIGPSGVGKSTIVSALVEFGSVNINPTWTTRPRRSDERHGCPEHIFVTETEFSQLARSGVFIETVQMFGLPYSYGLPALTFDHVDQVELVMLRAPLLDLLRKHYPNAIVYQIEDNATVVESRLKERYAEEKTMGSRLKDYDRELLLGRSQADRIFPNVTVGQTVKDIQHALVQDFGLGQ